MPLMRIPYTAPLPSPTIIPTTASTVSGAVDALTNFLLPHLSSSSSYSFSSNGPNYGKALIISGAGISVASGLADYRGTNGTYTLNKTYRPVYFHEFATSHEARKRYWARSFLGWTTLHRSRPNPAHHAVGALGAQELAGGLIGTVVTQNVDSFHPRAHPHLPTLELHGYLRSTVCLTCHTEYDREQFQADLAMLNPSWAAFLKEMLESGALTTEDPAQRRKLGLKTNPDGDVDVPGVQYSTFRYPACPKCLSNHRQLAAEGRYISVDADGGWALPTHADTNSATCAGILKPAVIMFGESISNPVKLAVESAVDAASRVLILGTSLATYSAWRLVKRAKAQGKPIAALNMGGIRGEELFFDSLPSDGSGVEGVRCSLPLEETLPLLVTNLRKELAPHGNPLTPPSRRAAAAEFVPAPWR